MTTLSQIAADVRRMAPEHFPAGFDLEDGADRIWFTSLRGTYPAPLEVARLALIGAMVLATHTLRCAGGWMPTAQRDGRTTSAFFLDRDLDPRP